MVWVSLFFGLLVLVVLLLFRAAKRAGPRQLDEAQLGRCKALFTITGRDLGGASPWSGLGGRTTSRGLDLKFDHDDDPLAEATLLMPGVDGSRASTLSNRVTVRLGSEFEQFHVHTGGFVFSVCMRGTDSVVGKETVILMLIDGKGRPYGGRIENDDDTDAAVGDWIEIRCTEILEVPRPAA